MQYYKIIGNLPIRFIIEMGLAACIEAWQEDFKNTEEFFYTWILGNVTMYFRQNFTKSLEFTAFVAN